jgi:hypothetical protein
VLGGHQSQVGADGAAGERCQSPISVASANPVSVDTPRKQTSRVTTALNSEVAAIVVIAVCGLLATASGFPPKSTVRLRRR